MIRAVVDVQQIAEWEEIPHHGWFRWPNGERVWVCSPGCTHPEHGREVTMQTETCPLCGSDLTGAPIPQEYIDKGYYPSGATHYSRMIGIYDTNLDRTVAWQCPDCGGQWQRGRQSSVTESDDKHYVGEGNPGRESLSD